MEETETHYIVDSDFEVPYLKGVTDEISWMPGAKNKGWAIGENDDPAEKIAENGGMRPFVYHVNAGYEYGYSTYNQDPCPTTRSTSPASGRRGSFTPRARVTTCSS